ncbi:MAG: hypothetical protein ACXV8Q_03600 [Methylobacter sp.]
MVHHERFLAARQQGEPELVLSDHWLEAERHYTNALTLRPGSASADLSSLHHQLGKLYKEVGLTDHAREQYEKSVQINEKTGDHYGAGQTRYNLSLMYIQDAGCETVPARKLKLLRRSEAYAQAALRDFQYFQGRATDWEAKIQQLIADIRQDLAAL